MPIKETQIAHKNAKTKELLRTFSELSKKLTFMEAKQSEYENLLQKYCGLMEKNQQLQQMIIYFSQSITGFTLKDLQSIEGNRNLRWNDVYLGMPLPNLFGDDCSFDKMPWSKLPFITKVYDQYDMVGGHAIEECKSEILNEGSEQRMIEQNFEGFDLNSVQENSSLKLPSQLPELARDSWSLISKSPNRFIEDSIEDEPKYFQYFDLSLLKSCTDNDNEGSFDDEKSFDQNSSGYSLIPYNEKTARNSIQQRKMS